jgi:hypothetical protein
VAALKQETELVLVTALVREKAQGKELEKV